MDGRLAEFSIVRIFPFCPCEPAENFIEQPDGMVVWDSFFKAGWDEDDLISGTWRRLPVASIDRFLQHLSVSMTSEHFLQGLIYGSLT